MKRTTALVIIFVLVLCLTGCGESLFNKIFLNESLTQEQSRKNFADYEERLKKVLEPYHLTLIREEEEDDDSKYGLYRHFLIVPDATAKVNVQFSNNASEDVSGFPDTGREEFTVIYFNNGQKELNVALFVDLVNTVSGRQITKEYCEAFLSDPEEKHPSTQYGFEKKAGELVKKMQSLNFGDDWAIGYTLYDDDREKLSFSGLTKEGTKKE